MFFIFTFFFVVAPNLATPLNISLSKISLCSQLLLVHFGADVMAVDNEGNTPLHLSCANGHDDVSIGIKEVKRRVKKLLIY